MITDEIKHRPYAWGTAIVGTTKGEGEEEHKSKRDCRVNATSLDSQGARKREKKAKKKWPD